MAHKIVHKKSILKLAKNLQKEIFILKAFFVSKAIKSFYTVESFLKSNTPFTESYYWLKLHTILMHYRVAHKIVHKNSIFKLKKNLQNFCLRVDKSFQNEESLLLYINNPLYKKATIG